MAGKENKRGRESGKKKEQEQGEEDDRGQPTESKIYRSRKEATIII